MGMDRTKGDFHAYHGTCTRERTGSVLHGSRFSRYQAFGHRIIRSKSGSIGLSQFSRLHCILLPQRRPENSEEALSLLPALQVVGKLPPGAVTPLTAWGNCGTCRRFAETASLARWPMWSINHFRLLGRAGRFRRQLDSSPMIHLGIGACIAAFQAI